MIFASDNWAGAHPRIAAALSTHASGFEPAYGNGSLDAKVQKKFAEIFEREVAVFFVGTGTAANALSLVSANKPGGLSFCHRESHIMEDECGAPEYFMGGSRLFAVDGPLGRIDPANLTAAVERFAVDNVHAGRPAAISITQATEIGTVYGLDQIRAISAIAKKHSLPLHMDGARFANALVALETTPAEMTWKSGVDIVSFGGTKNGCWCAEAVIMFDLDQAEEFGFVRKRAAQLFSKSRFIAAQFDAYFEDGLWLETAAHSNAMSARLAGHIRASDKVRLAWESQANEVFAIMPVKIADVLQEKRARFYDWHTPAGFGGEIAPGEKLWRFVTSFATKAQDVDRFGELIA
ncbi:low specificity L-threonine aldolase [Mesorhizobium sp. KR9-304]|uniref:threonine aldolase family protein n=1 Tax=Mesorhizobium sp. KR9-304 TaxID=3156614 RepID=UPI0032B44115